MNQKKLLTLRSVGLMFIVRKWPAIKQAIRRTRQGFQSLPRAWMRGNGVRSFWGERNFGDLMTPLLLENLGYTPINCPTPSVTEVLLVGSILDSLRNDYHGVILGSGFLRADRVKSCNKAIVLGVRGRLTKHRLGVTANIPLGDLGLIVTRVIGAKQRKQYEVGIVPHYSDRNDKRVATLVERFGEKVTVIDVREDPRTVVNKIASCEHILSSSLHGLVVADSLGIPNAWVKLSSKRSDFKYHDYYSAFGLERKPVILTGEETFVKLRDSTADPPATVESVINNLYEQFLSLPSVLGKNHS